MSQRYRILLIISGIILLALIIGAVVIRMDTTNDSAEINTNLTEEELRQQQVNAIVQSAYEKLLFIERPSSDGAIQSVPLAVSDFLTTETAIVDMQLSAYYSNFLPEQSTWFSIDDGTLRTHTFTKVEEITRIVNPVAENSLRGQVVSLAASPDGKYVAWISVVNNKKVIVLYDLTANSETVIYNPETLDTYSNLTWSPDSTELAFTDSKNAIITITPLGAQLQNPFSIPFTEFNHLTWIETDHLAAVVTSTEEHPEPFNPKVIVFNRQGEIIEEHYVLERAGIPRVLWSPDAKHFMYYDQWKNNFVVYDRFNTITQLVNVEETGKLIPFGWTPGIPSANMPITITPVTNGTITVEPNMNISSQFTITADQWDQYNETSRAVVKQFKADMSSYRFETTDRGIYVSVALLPEQTNPEASFVEILLQTMVLLPDVPAMSLDILYNETDHLVVNNITKQDLETVVDTFTTVPLTELFVVNTKNPYGKPRPKTENPAHNYFGDLLYSKTGDYNPVPVLAAMRAIHNEQSYIAHEQYSVLRPQTWQLKDLSKAVGAPYQIGDVLFFTGETNFASVSSWSGFSTTIRTYSIPEGASINDWLLVNRNDKSIEDVQIPLQSNMEAKKVITNTPYSLEYVLRSDNTIYVVSMEHPPALTPEEIHALDTLVSSFSDNKAFER